jgi:hypothetical protein
MRELVKLHGGKMLKSFDQTKYVKKKKFPKHLSEASALPSALYGFPDAPRVRISSNIWTPTRRAPK